MTTDHVSAMLPRNREASKKLAATRRGIGAAMLAPVSGGPTAAGLNFDPAYHQYIYTPRDVQREFAITPLRADTTGHMAGSR